MLSAKQGSIKYHFWSFWYDSTWDWTQVSRAIGEHSKYYAKYKFKLSLGCKERYQLFKTSSTLGTYINPFDWVKKKKGIQ